MTEITPAQRIINEVGEALKIYKPRFENVPVFETLIEADFEWPEWVIYEDPPRI